MKAQFFYVVTFSTYYILSYGEDTFESTLSDKKEALIRRKPRKCPYTLKKLWHIETSSFPFSAPPLVTDADGDGGLDVVVAPFGETLTVIEGETGKQLHGSNWPQQNLDKSIFSSPLQFDIDGDGSLDILFISSSGEGFFYTNIGVQLPKYSFQLPPVFVLDEWFKEIPVAGLGMVSQFVSQEMVPGYIPVDAHVLSTPVLYQARYLVLPMSYFYSNEDYSNELKEKPWGKENNRTNYYVSAISIVDLLEFRSSRHEADEINKSIHAKTFYLELHQSPVYGLFTPTVCDLDGDFGETEIIHGTSSGKLFVLDFSGQHRHNFPKDFGSSVTGRVSVADTNQDGVMELYVLTSSGRVTCVDSKTAATQWTIQIEGSIFPGSSIVDVDMDGYLDIVVTTNLGDVYALHTVNGSVIKDFPYKAESSISGNALVTKLNKRPGVLDLVFLTDDGTLHILATDQSCESRVFLHDKSLVDMVSHDIVLMNRGLEVLIASSDGSVICLGSGQESSPEELVDKELRLAHHYFIYPRDPMAQNDALFSTNKVSVLIDDSTKSLKEVTGIFFNLRFSTFNLLPNRKYNIRVYLGSDVVYQIDQVLSSAIPKSLKIQTPDEPGQGQVTLVMIDQFGLAYSDSMFLLYNQLILLDLQWLVIAPFIMMVIILLVNHGFPAKDLLPVTFPFKSK